MPNILVVDDSSVDRSLAKSILEAESGISVSLADNGRTAINRISESEIDLVVSDLMMPEVDGLELVERVRTNFSEVPVVVMTSAGSAMNAADAMRIGAASFVPKAQLANRLLDTVKQVLALKSPTHRYHRVAKCLHEGQVTFQLPANIELIPDFVDLVQLLLSSTSVCDATESIRLSLAVEEALLNALVHGNLELTEEVAKDGIKPKADYFSRRVSEQPYKDRKTFITIEISEARAAFHIRDEGPGFDISQLPGDQDLSVLQDGIGRGYMIMRSFMDEVRYSGNGNQLQLVRQFANTTNS